MKPVLLGYQNDSTWTGEMTLELRNARNWSVQEAELSVRRDTVTLHHAGRDLANLDRQQFRAWLLQADPDPLHVDDVVWSTQFGTTFLSAGAGSFRVTPESLASLVMVI
jgi:hypothetical protein